MIEKGQGEDLFLKDEDMQLVQKGYGCNVTNKPYPTLVPLGTVFSG